MEKVILVPQQDVHSGACDAENISGVFINVPLEVQDVFWFCQEGSLICLGLSVFLKGLPVLVGVHLLFVEKQKLHLIKVFMFEALTEIREGFVRRHEGPMFPNGVLEDSHMDLVSNVERQMLEAIEEGSQPRGLARANAGESSNSFSGEDLMNAKGEDIASVPWVPGGWCNRN